MKRFVSYLYSIYNNQKIHNAGFARIELRTGRNRVDIHLKENGYSGKTGTVYLFIRKQENIQGISIGNITFRNNQADFRYEQAEENIGQSPWQIMQMNGILVMVDDRAAFLSQWDEQPVDTTRFEVWNVDKLKEEGVDAGTEDQEKQQEDNDKTEQSELENMTDIEQPVSEQLENRKMSLSVERTEAENISPVAECAETSEQTKDERLEIDEGESNVDQHSNIRTAELQPQPQSQWIQTWRYMLRTYPVMNQFTDKNNVLCVRIEIKDVRLLPEKYWSMINNSFLLHGFFNYRHLAFGRIDQNWFVGVPGIYQNQEHVMASIFGFPDFLPQKQKNERGEQLGYWYRILEIV